MKIVSHSTGFLIWICVNKHIRKKKEFGKIKLRRSKKKKKKAVKDQLKEITALSKSYDDRSENILRVVAKLCGLSKGQRQMTA